MATPRFWDSRWRLKSPVAPGRVEHETEQAQASPVRTEGWSNRPAEAGERHWKPWDRAQDFPRWEQTGPPQQEGIWRWWRTERWHGQKQSHPPGSGPHYDQDPHWIGPKVNNRSYALMRYANLQERRQSASASVEAVPCLGDDDVRERWREHVEVSRDPERSAKRIHWLISRLQMQGFNRPVEPGQESPEKPMTPLNMNMVDLLEIAKKETETSDVGENLMSTELNTDEKDKDDDDFQEYDPLELEETQFERRRRERRKRRSLRDERMGLDKPFKPLLPPAVTDLKIFDDFLHNRSKLGLLLGWLAGRVAAFLAGFIFAKLGTPIPGDSEMMKVLGAPVHWLIACIAAAWLGSIAVTRLENHSTWKIGCLAACVFTLVV